MLGLANNVIRFGASGDKGQISRKAAKEFPALLLPFSFQELLQARFLRYKTWSLQLTICPGRVPYRGQLGRCDVSYLVDSRSCQSAAATTAQSSKSPAFIPTRRQGETGHKTPYIVAEDLRKWRRLEKAHYNAEQESQANYHSAHASELSITKVHEVSDDDGLDISSTDWINSEVRCETVGADSDHDMNFFLQFVVQLVYDLLQLN
ncbi:hypothetical protein AXG93_3891s1140 [Marchantia polymorpha subsp. ruderalis]|uniref:Uncharacterized protein n=1 Tax=Marchantia polymorpha subsp. ruderalis TaxID=1480154 RepID=A0A176WMY7_MARPO|nr:hypothetical protein AXG93_3891s1140 [Marchantia polymorpha subsp. ruderalis]